MILMHRISRHSRGEEGFQVSDRRIAAPLFADDVFLMASSLGLQSLLDWFTAECKAAGMKISTSKSKAMVLNRKQMQYLLHVGNKLSTQVKESKYLGALFTT